MKILLIHNYYRYRGGEDRYAGILENSLKRKGHQVVRFFYDSRDIDNFSIIQKLLIPIRLLNSSNINRQLTNLLSQEKPNLAIVHNLAPLLSLSILRVLKKNRVPILKRLENYKYLCLNGLFLENNFKTCERCKNGNFLPGIFRRCYQYSFFNSLGLAIPEWFHRRSKTVTRTVNRFMATSQFLKSKYVEAGFPADKIDVYPNFIDFEPITGISSLGTYAIYIGRLSKEKGLLTLLKAFTKFPKFPLKILGDGPLEKELKEFVHSRDMKNVEFAGYIDGPLKREILTGARFLIFPSECYESFGYPIIESGACGVPVIASDTGGARELIIKGETGFLFEPGNPDDLGQTISQMLALNDGDLMAMKEKSLEHVNELYTREIGYRNLEHIFNRMGL